MAPFSPESLHALQPVKSGTTLEFEPLRPILNHGRATNQLLHALCALSYLAASRPGDVFASGLFWSPADNGDEGTVILVKSTDDDHDDEDDDCQLRFAAAWLNTAVLPQLQAAAVQDPGTFNDGQASTLCLMGDYLRRSYGRWRGAAFWNSNDVWDARAAKCRRALLPPAPEYYLAGNFDNLLRCVEDVRELAQEAVDLDDPSAIRMLAEQMCTRSKTLHQLLQDRGDYRRLLVTLDQFLFSEDAMNDILNGCTPVVEDWLALAGTDGKLVEGERVTD